MALELEQGRDTYCMESLQPGRTARGVQLLAQRCFHRLTTPQGSLRGGEEEANFGRDLSAFVGSTDPRNVDSMLPVIVRNELLKDPTVYTVTATALRVVNAGKVSWTLAIKVDSAVGALEMLVAVTDVTVSLLGVS